MCYVAHMPSGPKETALFVVVIIKGTDYYLSCCILLNKIDYFLLPLTTKKRQSFSISWYEDIAKLIVYFGVCKFHLPIINGMYDNMLCHSVSSIFYLINCVQYAEYPVCRIMSSSFAVHFTGFQSLEELYCKTWLHR